MKKSLVVGEEKIESCCLLSTSIPLVVKSSRTSCITYDRCMDINGRQRPVKILYLRVSNKVTSLYNFEHLYYLFNALRITLRHSTTSSAEVPQMTLLE
jgi:hypothetical protein